MRFWNVAVGKNGMVVLVVGVAAVAVAVVLAGQDKIVGKRGPASTFAPIQ